MTNETEEISKEQFESLFNENRKAMDKCRDCKKFKFRHCNKHQSVDQYLRFKMGGLNSWELKE